MSGGEDPRRRAELPPLHVLGARSRESIVDLPARIVAEVLRSAMRLVPPGFSTTSSATTVADRRRAARGSLAAIPGELRRARLAASSSASKHADEPEDRR